MFLTPEEASQRTNSPDNLANSNDTGKVQKYGDHTTRFSRKEQIVGDISIRPFWNGGRRPGDNNVPQFIREIAAVAAQYEPAHQVAKNLNLSLPQVDRYSQGEVTDGKKDAALIEKINDGISGVRELAINKLMSSMSLITDDKLGKLKATELSRVAADMSKVVGSAVNKKENTVDRIIVFAPESKTETHYTMIEVNQ